MRQKIFFRLSALAMIVGIFISIKTLGAGSILYFEAPALDFAPGTEFPVRVLVDTAVPLNAYSVTVRYSTDILEILSVNTGKSIIDVWQNVPIIFADGRIEILGGGLRAFEGEKGELASITFRVLGAGKTELRSEGVRFFAADGKGTRVIPDIKPLILTFTEEAPAFTLPPQNDTTPPEITLMTFTPDPIQTDQKLFVLSAIDAESGIKKITVRFKKFLFWGEPRTIYNPIGVDRGTWAAEAVLTNNAEITKVAYVYDWIALLWTAMSFLSIVIFLAGGVYYLARRRK